MAKVVDFQKFLGWYNHAGPRDIAAALDDHHEDYVKEKLVEHRQNRVLFAYRWYEDLMAYYMATDGKLIDPTVYPSERVGDDA